MATTATKRSRARVEPVRSLATGGLLTRLDLLAHRRNAQVSIVHANHRWVVGLAWSDDENDSHCWARAEGRFLVGVLVNVLGQASA